MRAIQGTPAQGPTDQGYGATKKDPAMAGQGTGLGGEYAAGQQFGQSNRAAAMAKQ